MGAEVRLGFVEVVDLCSQDEIAFRQALDLLRPDCDLDFSPSKEDVWVVPLVLRKFAYALYELEAVPWTCLCRECKGTRALSRLMVSSEPIPKVSVS